MQLLRSRLYDIELEKQNAEEYNKRKSQIGSGSRSEKIRTYNYKDSRVTDHRLGENFPLPNILGGQLVYVHGKCVAMTQQELMAELIK